jgi:hypothetical protein
VLELEHSQSVTDPSVQFPEQGWPFLQAEVVLGASPCRSTGAPVARSSGAWRFRVSWLFRSPFRSALRQAKDFRYSGISPFRLLLGYYGLC